MNKLKNIINLSNLFIKENNNFNLINKETKKINTKSPLFWIIIILVFGLSYISQQIIIYLKQLGKIEIFLNGYFLFLEIILIIQTIMVSTNIFYFSKDTEYILPLPFKPVEILLGKFNTLLFMLYSTEIIFALVPFLIYGIYADMGILFFIKLILCLIIFPIFVALIISIVMMFLMKTIKLFKNKDMMQLIISFILIFLVMSFLISLFNNYFLNSSSDETTQTEALEAFNDKIISINNYFLTVTPVTKILSQNNFIKTLFYFLELILINFFGLLIFCLLGKKFYLKQLLKNNFYIKNKKNNKINLNKKCKKNKKGISYIKKEFKLLFKNPLFLIQNIYPIILTTIMIIILLIAFIPKIEEILYTEEYKEILEGLTFDFEAVCLILGLTQIVGLFNYSSITAFSREGQESYIMKYLPISFYKQFIYKNIPQIFINTISSIFILGIIAYEIPAIKIQYIFIIFGLNILLTIINSFILCFIDLINPKINWKAEYEIFKNNKNKLLQYVLIILNILFLYYFSKVLINYNLFLALFIFGCILIFILIIMNIFIFKLKNKLYKKIG